MIAAIAPIYKESPQLVQSLIEHLSNYKNISQIVIAATEQDARLPEIQFLIQNWPDQKRVKLVISHSHGRSAQMNCGANQLDVDLLLFVHCDTRLPKNADHLIINSLKTNQWGRFDVQLDDNRLILKIISWFMNKRSRLTSISTGDQAIFMTDEFFKLLGGFPDQVLMEDIEFSKRAKKISPSAFISAPVVTSARRWLQGGIVKTVLLMWRLRALYWFGVKPDELATMYRQIR